MFHPILQFQCDRSPEQQLDEQMREGNRPIGGLLPSAGREGAGGRWACGAAWRAQHGGQQGAEDLTPAAAKEARHKVPGVLISSAH